MTTTIEPATNPDTQPVMTMFARGGWITKTARADALPDPMFVTAGDRSITLYFRSITDLHAWANWADLTTTSSPTELHVLHTAAGELWDIPLELVFVEKLASTAAA